jgi:hypothetical protein
MIDKDVLQATTTLAELHAAHIKANAQITVVVLSALVRANVLSVETVDQMLTQIEYLYESLPGSGSEVDQAADQREAEAGLQLVQVIRRRLLPE